MKVNAIGNSALAEQILAAALEVHQTLGPALPKEAYTGALRRALTLRCLSFETDVWLPEQHKNLTLNCGYGLDFVVEGRAVVEVRAQSGIEAEDEDQLLNYLRLSGLPVGILINFRERFLDDGVRTLCYATALSAAG